MSATLCRELLERIARLERTVDAALGLTPNPSMKEAPHA